MNLDDKIQEAIQRYLTGQMTDAERVDFDKQIAESPEIAAEVRTWREFRVIAKNKEFFHVAASLDKWMDEIGDNPPPNEFDKYFADAPTPPLSFWQKPTGRWILRGGILVLVALAAFFGYRTVQDNKKAEERSRLARIADSYTKPLENFVGFAPNNTSPFVQMLKFYDQKQYNEAAQFYEATPSIQSDQTVQLYAAVCYLLTDKTQKAADILRGLNKAQFIHRNIARRYLALALLKLGNADDAIPILEALKADARFGKEAEEILRKMNKE